MVDHLDVRTVALSELLDPEMRSSAPAAFVGDSWQRSTHRPLEELRELLRSSVCVVGIATPVARPDLFLGWAAVIPSRNAIIAVYVKNTFRAPKVGESEFRVGSSLLIKLGVDFGRSVPCLSWSKAAARIAAKAGNPYNLVRELTETSEWAAGWT